MTTTQAKFKYAPGIGRVGFAFIGCRWYAVDNDGQVMLTRPVEHGESQGIRPCVHCHGDYRGYCKSCRQCVCAPCWPIHKRDHDQRNAVWTHVKVDYV